mgnify:FL=1|jgi:hypothetical protein|tara:strand:- start:659 stop:952 length:294 start_codon:yes stop_codon:yes gene_type:complete
MIKKRIEKVLIFLKETLIVETEDAREMLKVYYDYTKGNASEEEVESANKQLNKLLKDLSFGLLTVVPLAPITIPLIAKFTKKYGIDILPDWFKDSLK